MSSDSQRFMCDPEVKQRTAGRWAHRSSRKSERRPRGLADEVNIFTTMEGARADADWDLTQQRHSTISSSKDIHGSILTRKVRNSTSPTRAHIPRPERGFSSILLSILSNINLDHIKSDIPTFRGRSPDDHSFLGSQVSLRLTWIADYVYNDRARSYIPYP